MGAKFEFPLIDAAARYFTTGKPMAGSKPPAARTADVVDFYLIVRVFFNNFTTLWAVSESSFARNKSG
jgi:hypothetical protein